jgi:hypothetical protein
MKNWRNLLLLLAFLGFGVWYGGSWAYRTQYDAPRKKLQAEIVKAEQNKAWYEGGISDGKTVLENLAPQKLHQRSLPIGNAATLYHSWLIAAGEDCQFENFDVEAWRVQPTQAYSSVLSYQLYARTTLDDLSRFLYEFYWAPYLHRIVELNITPVENADLVDIIMQIQGLVLAKPDPNAQYPLYDRLPDGYWPRLSSGLLETYTEPINSRNLLQFSRGGNDAADYARLTGIIYVGGEPEFWFNNQLENQTTIIKLNHQFRIGSFFGTIIEVIGQDVILETTGTSSRPGLRWSLSQGELLKNATAVDYKYPR